PYTTLFRSKCSGNRSSLAALTHTAVPSDKVILKKLAAGTTNVWKMSSRVTDSLEKSNSFSIIDELEAILSVSSTFTSLPFARMILAPKRAGRTSSAAILSAGAAAFFSSLIPVLRNHTDKLKEQMSAIVAATRHKK